MHAVLPKELLAQEIRKRIEDMEEGEEGSALPYAMAADSDDHLWLDPGALVTLNADSYFLVRKTKDGYEVVVDTNSSYRWEHGEVDNSKHLDIYTIPVIQIKIINRFSEKKAS
jgi:hypothetical protein